MWPHLCWSLLSPRPWQDACFLGRKWVSGSKHPMGTKNWEEERLSSSKHTAGGRRVWVQQVEVVKTTEEKRQSTSGANEVCKLLLLELLFSLSFKIWHPKPSDRFFPVMIEKERWADLVWQNILLIIKTILEKNPEMAYHNFYYSFSFTLILFFVKRWCKEKDKTVCPVLDSQTG